MHAEAHAIRAARQARAVEQLVGNFETVGTSYLRTSSV